MTDKKKQFYEKLIKNVANFESIICIEELKEFWNPQMREEICNNFPLKPFIEHNRFTNFAPTNEPKIRIKSVIIRKILY